ncbi:MAG: hypothetical protein ACI94Y_004222, partial [Maribacter sp.]
DMKSIILFVLISFPCLFYLEPVDYTGDIPCEITFYSHLNQESKNIPFIYETDCDLSHLEIDVFDQWGVHTYSTHDINLEWYGKKEIQNKEGKKEIILVPEGTYYYVAQYKFDGDSTLFKTDGSIMVQL